MEDVVAVEVRLTDERSRYFMTWGRIQDAVNPAPLEKLILRLAAHFAIDGEPATARLCKTLREASQEPFFYEALTVFSRDIPFGADYARWRKRMKRRMREGHEIYFLGCRERHPADDASR